MSHVGFPQVVGVAFQSLVNAENMGFIIPVPIIKHFLKDIELHGEYTVLDLAPT
jgi:S1-C subfamily serine protease